MQKRVERRGFLKGMAAALSAMTLPGSAKANLFGDFSFGAFLQKHYKELSADDKKKVFARIEEETKKKYGVEVKISDPQPIENVHFAFALDLNVCNGSRFCVDACVKENNPSRDPQIQFIRVLEMERGSFDFEKGNLHYKGEAVPEKDKFYIPMQCNQCDNPPCVKVCPTEATWKEKDGIVVIDYNWCIGCRYCMAACPYGARRFNLTDPVIPKEEINPKQGYLSNRIRPVGVVEKCFFCLHRTREGKLPACLEACPTGARKFGNLLDPTSDIAKILKNKIVFVLKEELNTIPKFFYYFG
ncbi:MAG: 4Fe-4S dicluster domain-containing protein [Bdellovibrio sp.]|nr:4Fe-4S dicluster domain-containing protein [Bdellovibrio sp.]